jgi:hypothetical protein
MLLPSLMTPLTLAFTALTITRPYDHAPSTRLSMMAQPSSSASPHMPPVLLEWGCDAALWEMVRGKQALIKLADAGDEAACRERIAMLRRSPSITKRDDISEMPAVLSDWGCDVQLWARVKSKAALAELAALGAEGEELGRARISHIRLKIAEEDAAAADTLARRRAKKLSKPSKWAKKASRGGEPLTGEPRPGEEGGGRKTRSFAGYRRAGALPEGLDMIAIEGLLAKRKEAKFARNFEEADALQKQLKDLGVRVNDKRRTIFDASSDWS